MKKNITAALLLTIMNHGFAQSGVGGPVALGDTYKIKLYRDDCKDGKCKEGGTGTLTFKSYSDIKEYSGSFGEENAFVKGLLTFTNGDTYEGSFKTSRANKIANLDVAYDSGTYTKKNAYRYTAKFENGRPNGETVIVFSNGAEYKGSLKNGLYDGLCSFKYSDGGRYTGHYKEGYLAGTGKMEYASGLIYEGDWAADSRSGKGVFTNTKEPGYYFSGVFKDNYPNGRGKLVRAGSPDTLYGDFSGGHQVGFFQRRSPSGNVSYQYFKNDSALYSGLTKLAEDRYCINGNCAAGRGKLLDGYGNLYEGEVKDGKAEGAGTRTFTDGSVYTGSFSANKYSGRGKIVWPDKSYYEGEFKNDLREGIGTYHWADGSLYEGNWIKGDKWGKGKYTAADGSTYDGEWQNNQHHGKGTYVWGNNKWKGDKYEGQWEAGYRTGKGVYLSADGTKFEGNFSNDNYSGNGVLTTSAGDIYESTGWNGYNFTSGTYTKKGGTAVQGALRDNGFVDAAQQKAEVYAAQNPGVNGVIPVSTRLNDMNSGRLSFTYPVTHAVKSVNLAKGYYSVVVADWPMIASFARGFKQYYLVAGPSGKKNPVPFGVHITYEFINSHGELIGRQSVSGWNLEGVFDAPVDGKYTIQAKYDFEGCTGCDQPGGVRLDFTLLSKDYTYK